MRSAGAVALTFRGTCAGLPKEHADELCRPYLTRKEQLRTQFAKESLRLPKLQQLDWRVDYVLSSSKLSAVNAPTATLKVSRDDGQAVAFEVSADKFAVLYSGATLARRALR